MNSGCRRIAMATILPAIVMLALPMPEPATAFDRAIRPASVNVGAVAQTTAQNRILVSDVRLQECARAIGQYLKGVSGSDLKLSKPCESKVVPMLIEALDHEDVAIRVRAAGAFNQLHTKAVPALALPALIETLNDPSKEVRDNVIGALRTLGPWAKPAVPALLALPTQQHENISLALRRIGTDAIKAAIPVLLDSLDDDDARVRRHAVQVLWALRWERPWAKATVAIPALIAILKNQQDDREMHAWAAALLGELVASSQAADPALMDTIGSDRKPAAERIADDRLQDRDRALAAIGLDARTVVPLMIKLLQYPENDQRYLVVSALGQMGSAAKAAIPTLVQALNHKDSLISNEAVVVLGEIGSGARGVVPALVEALDDREETVRIDAALALGNLGTEAKAAVPRLRDILQKGNLLAATGRNATARASTALALWGIHSDPQVALAALISALNRTAHHKTAPAARFRAEAVSMLGSIRFNSRQTVPVLIRFLHQDANHSVRGRAAQALAGFGPEVKATIPALIQALQDENDFVVSSAAEVLARFGAEASVAVPALIRALQDERVSVRSSATYALSKMGPEARGAIPALMPILQDESDFVRVNAAAALRTLGVETEVLMPVLIGWLQDDHLHGVISLLGAMGADAEAAVPSLVQLLQTEEEPRYVAAALAKIGPVVIPALVETLHHERQPARYSAAFALAQMGPAAQDKNAIKVLRTVVSDKSEDLDVRWMAAVALEQINPALSPQDFFAQNHLVGLHEIACPKGNERWGTVLDEYTGYCEITGSGAGWEQIIDWIAKRKKSRRR